MSELQFEGSPGHFAEEGEEEEEDAPLYTRASSGLPLEAVALVALLLLLLLPPSRPFPPFLPFFFFSFLFFL